MSQPTALYDDVAGGSYVRGYYGVPAYKDRRITFCGRPGTVVGFDGQYVLATFDHLPSGEVLKLHPTWRVAYLDAAATAGGAA